MLNRRIIFKILFISAAIGLLFNFFSGNGINLLPKEIVLKEVSGFDSLSNIKPGTDSIEIKTINIETVYKLFLTGKVYFIDGRDKWDYSEGHIPNAINLPEYKIDELNDQIEQLDKKNKYIVYCSGEDCNASKRLAEVLINKGFSNVLVYLGGFEEWSANKYPIEVTNE